MKLRAHKIGELMTNDRSGNNVGQTAINFVKQMAKQDFYGYESPVINRYLDKGINQEFESIQLLNAVRFEDFHKNAVRKTNDFITGECDIVTVSSIIDIKTSWSLETFPELPEEINSKTYEWQGRAYMWLYDKPEFELVYCMVSTWDEFLTPYDDRLIHKVDHIDPAKRITSIKFERDLELEEQMIERVKWANEYYKQRINKLNNK